MDSYHLAIVIPCYNEYDRLEVSHISEFLDVNTDTAICFVDDASNDGTATHLEALCTAYPNRVQALSNAKNLGKAASVRKGVLHCSEQRLAHNYAYLDADFAVSLTECRSLLHHLQGEKQFVFASRILKVGSVVERKFSRFLFGRVIATFISNILDIKVYDTQCGCKVFGAGTVPILFKEAFISKWLFDVELFSRLLCAHGKERALEVMDEIPVRRWVDKGESKVKMTYVFRLWYDLYAIRKTHRANYAQVVGPHPAEDTNAPDE
ncbi:glycosyltransferase [Maribacter sp. 2307ULW6-5]|uniref:glycosyltransferase n=1 Tax=Maribacter sp. 2307ULW6-5 TaxID=3386275 RepID=UPI0039BC9782